jgi:putative CocE/NonD family hydrolase
LHDDLDPRPRILPDQAISMRDGVALVGDVFFPPGWEGPLPTLLLATAYGRRRPGMMKFARGLSEGGFAVVLLDVRGCFQAGGEFLQNEGEDGFDTLAWAGSQDWCNGRIGLIGISLTTIREFLTASQPAPEGVEVRAIVNLGGALHLRSGFYQGGALILHWALPWTVMMSPQWMGRLGGWQRLPWPELFRHLPLAEVTERTSGAVDAWRLAMEKPFDEESWRRVDARRRLGSLQAPVLHVSGWYDNTVEHVLEAYRHLAVEQSLVLGPWDHQTLFFALLGSPSDRTELGTLASFDLLSMVLNWFDRWLVGEASGEGPRALAYVMEAETWLELDRFPPAEAREESWYLTSRGQANTAEGDGVLLPEKPEAEGMDRFLYDPADPVPTRGGALWPFPAQGLAPGQADQREVELRPDVLVYTSAPLGEDLLLAGAVAVELWAATSGLDTDFTAKLVDVAPAGAARLVCDGIVRCSFAEGPLEPGRRYRWQIELGSIAHCLRAAHRLRLEVSSSNFPKYDRNLNTGEPLHTGRAGVPSEQTVFHGGDAASRLLLTVAPASLLETRRWKGAL